MKGVRFISVYALKKSFVIDDHPQYHPKIVKLNHYLCVKYHKVK